jgi:co-chaperonin GroES (HSP10)
MSKLAFEPHKISKDKLHPIKDWIVVTNMNFEARRTRMGLIIPGDDAKSAGIRPRWCQIYKFGPEYTGDLQIGDYILVSHGRWTRGIEIEDEEGVKTLRRVDPDDILLVSDEPMDDETMSDKVV